VSHPSYTQSLALVTDYISPTTSSYKPDTPGSISTNKSSSTYIARSSQLNTTLTHFTPSQQHPASNSINIDLSQYTSLFTVLRDSLTFTLNSDSDIYEIFIKTTKKYKPVTLKIKPVKSMLPSQFCIIRNIIGDPLTKPPHLNPNPLLFTPTGRYTQECKE
jgi:hypothetical protein